VLLCRPAAADALERARHAGAVEQAIGRTWRWDADDAPACVLLRLAAACTDGGTPGGIKTEAGARPRPTASGVPLRWAASDADPTVLSWTTP
jgi:hypothetical protein